MTPISTSTFETISPSDADARLALEAGKLLNAGTPDDPCSLRLEIQGPGSESRRIDLPSSALPLLARLISELSMGHSVTLVPTRSEVTTQEAADILNVSRPYVVKLIEEGALPSRSVGRFRRIRLVDLMAYKQKDDESRSRTLDQLTAEAQELGLGY